MTNADDFGRRCGPPSSRHYDPDNRRLGSENMETGRTRGDNPLDLSARLEPRRYFAAVTLSAWTVTVPIRVPTEARTGT